MSDIIKVIDLKKQYENDEVVTPVLHGMSFTIEQGEFVSIMGPSGSGKSTLMHILGFLDHLTTGQYLFEGRDASDLNEDELATMRSSRVGFVFQQFNLLPKTSVLQNVKLPLVYVDMSEKERDERALKAITAVGLEHRANFLSNQLSGGEKQRVAIARALVNNPSVIFADEPTGNLDSKSGVQIMNILDGLNDQGKTVILVTHETNTAAHAKRILKLKDGLLVADERVSDELRRQALSGELMDFRGVLALSVNNLRRNPMRSFLTMLGLIIGIGSVVLIMAVGAGAQALILSQVNKVGSNLIGVLPGASDEKGPPASVFGIVIKTLVNDDVKAIRTNGQAHHITAISGYARGVGKMTYENREIASGAFMGVESSYPDVENVTYKAGRFFTTEEDNGLARVTVIGSDIAQELFQGESSIGKTIKIKRESFKVIGEFESKGVSGFSNLDKQVFIPLNTVQKVLLGQRHLSLIRAAVDSPENINESIEAVKSILREKHNLDAAAEDDFSVRSAASAIDLLKNITDAFKFFLAAIAAISLVVGGIGIMNIMLVAVTERYREIGLRKAVGARKKNILSQFLLETIIVSMAGSIIGILGGALFAGLITIIARALDYEWEFVISFSSIVAAVGVGTIIGLVFGYYPATKAAALDPIVSLRYE